MITFIFGAGASFGSGACHPKSPPLGNSLFQELDALEGAFHRLPENSKLIFRDNGFEAGMASIADDSRVINPLQKEVAIYLSNFKVKSGNAYVRLFEKLGKLLEKLNLVTLNYDLLIEQSLAENGVRVDYNGNGEGVTLLKPHGSSNFLPEIPKGCVFSGNTMIGCGSFFDGLNTNAVNGNFEVAAWCQDPRNSDISPVLAMYAKGKRVVVNNSLVRETQEKYAELIANSEFIVLIGINYVEHDVHIWAPIKKAKSKILVVNPYPQSTIDWLQSSDINQYRVIAKSFEESIWDITKAVRRYMKN